MTVTSPSTPARVPVRTAAAVKELTTEQLHAILDASTRRSSRVLPVLWDTVRTADPKLSATLDELHADESEADLPRFIELSRLHQQNLSAATKSGTGKLIAARVVGAGLLAVGAILAGLAGIIVPGLAASAVVLSAFLYVGAFRAGRRMVDSLPTSVFANPHAAASIVWDAAVDASAAVVLEPRAGEAGLTPDVMKALAITWTSAGLSLDLLRQPPAPKATARKAPAPKAPGAKPAARRPGAKRTTKPAPAPAQEPAAA
jgi:hypothetical protein